MKSNERLLGDLITEVERDLSEGREDMGEKAVRIKTEILGRMTEPLNRAALRDAKSSDRHLLVMALLDIRLSQWEDWLSGGNLTLVSVELRDPAEVMISCLRDPYRNGNPALYVQEIAMLSDGALCELVTSVAGHNPLKGEKRAEEEATI